MVVDTIAYTPKESGPQGHGGNAPHAHPEKGKSNLKKKKENELKLE